jgi:hypothetical protein
MTMKPPTIQLCSDHGGEGPTIMDLPIPDELKAEWHALASRRQFLSRAGKSLAWAGLAGLFARGGNSAEAAEMRAAMLPHRRSRDHDARIAQYEMAFRMQMSRARTEPISRESPNTSHQSVLGRSLRAECEEPGTYAYNCLMARRLAERGVRFTQVYHRGWDQHGNLPEPMRCARTSTSPPPPDRGPEAARLLEDTLVVWGGEFGRTVYSQGGLTKDNYGRDHHPRCFCMWMAGGGVKGGVSYGETDDFSYNIVKDPSTSTTSTPPSSTCMGIDHERLSFKFQGLDQRLTGVGPVRSAPQPVSRRSPAMVMKTWPLRV